MPDHSFFLPLCALFFLPALNALSTARWLELEIPCIASKTWGQAASLGLVFNLKVLDLQTAKKVQAEIFRARPRILMT